MQRLFHDKPEVFIISIRLVIRGNIRISRHADIVLIRNFIFIKYQFQIFHDHFLHPDITDVMSRQIEHLRDILRHRHDARHRITALLQICHYIDFFIQEMRERMVRIYDLRGQHRKDLFLEILLDIFLFLLLQFLEIKTAHSVWFQLFFDLCICLIALFIQRRNCLIDCFELLFRRHAGLRIKLLVVHCRHVIEAAHADHKKLIQIARKDRDKFHSLHQRYSLIPCFLQHSLIKAQPGQLSVLRVVEYFLLPHLFLLLVVFSCLFLYQFPAGRIPVLGSGI